MDRAFIEPYCSSSRELYSELEQAIDSHNLLDLLQCFAEGTQLGVELTDSLPNSVSSFLKSVFADFYRQCVGWGL